MYAYVFLATDTCGKNGLTMSPEHAERFIFSRLRTQMSLVTAKGVPAIMHSDGDNTEIMEQWINMGFSGLHPVEPTGSFDIFEAKERWGDRIALFGNIDVAGVLGSEPRMKSRRTRSSTWMACRPGEGISADRAMISTTIY